MESVSDLRLISKAFYVRKSFKENNLGMSNIRDYDNKSLGSFSEVLPPDKYNLVKKKRTLSKCYLHHICTA
eukprot:snap_masked-scaffold_37-processed-gene-0.0-mRNA-1 protein AED:1.00 eAED:1.00 QI:0/0/0/0/1/1/2/0/70